MPWSGHEGSTRNCENVHEDSGQKDVAEVRGPIRAPGISRVPRAEAQRRSIALECITAMIQRTDPDAVKPARLISAFSESETRRLIDSRVG